MRIYIDHMCVIQFEINAMMKKVIEMLLLLLSAYCVVYYVPVEAQRTSTVTRTTTSTATSTVTILSKVVCAKLVNVTGVCRRRRGLPIDEPVILTFDDELEESVDEAFHHLLHPGQFLPTRTLGVEVTPMVMLPVNSHSDGYYKIHPLQGALNVVQPSMERPRYSGRNKLLRTGMNNEPSAESRIYFAQLAALASAIVNQLRPPVTVTTTITAVTTSFSTSTTFSTGSFFLMGCTPNPFPFSVCSAKRSVDPAE